MSIVISKPLKMKASKIPVLIVLVIIISLLYIRAELQAHDRTEQAKQAAILASIPRASIIMKVTKVRRGESWLNQYTLADKTVWQPVLDGGYVHDDLPSDNADDRSVHNNYDYIVKPGITIAHFGLNASGEILLFMDGITDGYLRTSMPSGEVNNGYRVVRITK